MKKILITGGAGFIGHNLVSALSASGDYAITILDQREPNFKMPNVQSVVGKFSDSEILAHVLPGTSVVVHLGSNALPANNDYVTDVRENLLGSIELIKQCENARVSKVVFASSGGTVYGPNAVVPTPEDAPRNPICSYGIIKSAVEDYLNLASRLSGMQTVSLRISNPYGPWQNWNSPQGVVSVFCHRVANGLPITLYGDGSVERDFIYIDDVVDAFIRAIEMDVLSGPINIASGSSISLSRIIEDVQLVCKHEAIVRYLPARECDVQRSCLSIVRARDYLGWSPKIDIGDGVKSLVAWQQKNIGAF